MEIRKILNLKVSEFVKIFETDTGKILADIFECYYKTYCSVEIAYIEEKSFNVMYYAYVSGDTNYTHHYVDYKQAKELTVDEFLTYLDDTLTHKFNKVHYDGVKLSREFLETYISNYYEVAING